MAEPRPAGQTPLPRNIALIGYRGTGKTSVGRVLAQCLGWAVVDADHELEQRAGQTIAKIFATAGEKHFRDLESQVLADLVNRERIVMALGGGVVGREDNCRLLRTSGWVVWLQASVATIVTRIATDVSTAARRPNLTKLGQADEVRTLLVRRAPLYQAAADAVVDTEGKSLDAIAAEILDLLEQRDHQRA